MGPPGGSQTPGGLQTHYRLTFGGITIKEKMLKKWWMDSWSPSGLRRSPGGVQPEYVEECKVLVLTYPGFKG
jgi:hypothetical protein